MKKSVKRITPLSHPRARIRIPGSKSISHRALIIAALASGESEIRNTLVAEDTFLTAKALEHLGVKMRWEGETVRVAPPQRRWHQPKSPILLGNSGTSMRLLLAVAAAGSGTFVFDGTPRLRERPILPVLEALEHVGVRIRCLKEHGFPPVEIHSEGLAGGDVCVDATRSSQFLSALLIASPLARQEMHVRWPEPAASFPYVELTLSMMQEAGIEFCRVAQRHIIVPAPQIYHPLKYQVEGDCSSAAYFWAAAALTHGEILTYPLHSGSPQGDCRLLDILELMGCRVQWEEDGVRVVGPERLAPVDLDMNKMPDMVPTLAVLAAFAQGETRIRNVPHLRVKESDRLYAVTRELAKFKVPVHELPDGLVIRGGRVQTPEAGIETHDDHRIAMAFAVMGLAVGGVEIQNADVVAKSFPSFWDAFEQLCSRINSC